MKGFKPKSNIEERRRYIRLDSVFPVSFRLVSLDGISLLSEWSQGYTSNVSKAGICLFINNLKPELANLLDSKLVKVSLKIEIPLNKPVIKAEARIIWARQINKESNKYLIGLSYERIDPKENERIVRYAQIKRLFTPLALTIIIILFFVLVFNSYMNIRLIKGNKLLVEQLVKIIQESSLAKQRIKKISKEKQDLELKLQALEVRIKQIEDERIQYEKQLRQEEIKTTKRIQELNSLVEKLSKEKADLQEELIALQNKENAVTEELLRLDKKRSSLTLANFNKMYRWLVVHQNPRTGLVMSFEGDKDIANWAFTYDQALVAQAYTYFSDYERTRKIFNFYKKALRKDKLFFNAYYVDDGSPAEYTIHSGPNLWLGIAIIQYTYKSKDKTYLDLALEIAEAIINLQDSEGGIRGGIEVNWYSTEHNLDAYAFFNMLYKITDKAQYKQIADKILDWLVKHSYDRPNIPIKRGKGDATIATDTYAWSIAAIGPEKLLELGMNPDMILDFAEKNCLVETIFIRPEGQKVKIRGFDFAPQRHVSRLGIVSSEWTAQMILSFRIMADFYYQKQMIAKARMYESKVDEYLSELSNMIISSPSPSGQGEGCLPYASADFVDTGHGWMTPKGRDTGSLAGTAYTLFAYYNYNPLVLKD
ncbi:MAG: PilZ domain-containing protein [Candidatus Omnitrophica bacterium]|nr:PilZ domain-containing protein [Candidatus Omnitrophota bacterium]